MSKAIVVSVLTNALLVAALSWMIHEQNLRKHAAVSALPNPSASPTVATSEPSPPEGKTNPPAVQAFHWRQLESTDYPTYVANLRHIGCPEQTVRDIITADVDSLYRGRREALLTNDGAFGSSWGTTDSLSEQLDALKREEASVLLVLLGPDAGGDRANTPATPARFVRRQDSRVVLPLVLQGVNLQGLNLTARELAAIHDVQQRFRDEMTGSGLAATDPAYRQLWLKAQSESDDLLQAMLGGEDFIDYELAARQASQVAP